MSQQGLALSIMNLSSKHLTPFPLNVDLLALFAPAPEASGLPRVPNKVSSDLSREGSWMVDGGGRQVGHKVIL